MNSCKICDSQQIQYFEGKIINKYNIQYFKCPNCGFVNSEKPYWLEESYSEAIADSDIGYVFRNLDYSKRLSRILKKNFNDKSVFLDYGGGYGLLVRLMRDNGFRFHYYDLYCKNIFAKGFELQQNHKVDAYTALEVFEHLENPLIEVKAMFEHTDTVIFSTLLRKNEYSSINDWWYFTPETGQHISIFTKKSLEIMAAKCNAKLYTNGKDLHILSKRNINLSSMKFDLLYSVLIQKIDKLFLRSNPSLLKVDYQRYIESIK